MKRLTRRSLGWLLVLAMLLSLATPTALAVEAGAEDTPEAVSTPEQAAAELPDWDADSERWCNTSGQFLNMPGGTEQHLRVSKYGETCSVTVSQCQEGTEFGLCAQIQEYSTPTCVYLDVSGTAPFQSSFMWEVEYGEGTEVGQNERFLASRNYFNYTNETFGESVPIPVFPGRGYWYRVTLIPLGADGSLDGAAVSREGTIVAQSAEITPLTVGEHNISSNSSGGAQRDFVFEFQPGTEGYYQITAVQKPVWDETDQGESPAWIALWNEEMSQWESNLEYFLHLSDNEVRYLHLSAFCDIDYTIQVTRIEQAVTEPAVEVGTVTAGGFFLQIPVTVSLPFRTSANIRVDFREENNDGSSVSEGDYLDSGNAEGVFPLSFEFETQLNTVYEYRVAMTVYGDNGEVVWAEEGDWISVNSGTPGAPLSMSMDVPTQVTFSDDGPSSVYGSVTPEKSGFYTASAESESTVSSSAYAYTYHANEYNPGWQWDSLAEPVYMQAGVSYYVRIDWHEPETVSVTFSALTITPLALGETLTGNWQSSYFSFEAEDEGEEYYKVEVTPENGDWWYLSFWNEASGEWESIGAQEPNAPVIHCPAGSVRYLQLSGNVGSYQITVSVLQSDVSDFSLEADSSQAKAAGLYVEIPYTAVVPLHSSFSIDLLYRDQNGGPQHRYPSYSTDQYLGDTFEATARIETKPETWYTCQLILRELSGSGRNVSSEEFYVYSGEPVNGIQELSPLADGTGYALTLNGGSGDTVVRFTPLESGWYQLGAESTPYGNNSLSVWNEAGGHWEPAENGQKLLLLEEGIPYYLRLWVNYGAACTVTASPYSPQVTGFSIKAPQTGAIQQDDAFSMRIPVSISMPLGSSFRYGLEYGEIGQRTPWRTEQEELNYPGESLVGDLQMDVRPGMSYQVRAFVTEILEDGSAGETIYSEFFTVKAAVLTTVILMSGKNEMPAPTAATQAHLLRFTAKEEGWYHIWSEPYSSMIPWNETEGRWGGDNKGSGTAADSVSSLFYLKAGQTLELRMDSYENCTVTVEEYTPSVTSFGIKAEEPQAVNGFLTELTFTVTAPLGSSFRTYVEYKAGEIVERAFVREVIGSASESMENWVRLSTMPDTAYQYRVCLIDSESGGELLADEWRTLQSPADASTAEEIPEGARKTLFRNIYTGSDEVIFRFTPEESGNYRLIVTGVNQGSLGIWDPSGKSWAYKYFPEAGSQVLSLTENATRYFRLSMWDAESCQVEIIRYQTTVTELTPPKVEVETDNGWLLSFFLSAQAPICSGQISLGILWGINEKELRNSNSRTFSDADTEYLKAEFTIPVVPGKTYYYQAYVKMYDEENLYATEIQSIAVSAEAGEDGKEPQELKNQIQQETYLDVGETAVYTFTAKKAGYYTLRVDYAFPTARAVLYALADETVNGTVTLLRKDGSRLDAFSVMESGEISVYLVQNEKIYLVYEASQAGTCLLEIVSKPLTVAWSDPARTKVRAELSAQTAGQYFFAVYDSEGKLLSCKFRTKTSEEEETFVAEFTGVSQAAYVKAFVVDSGSGYCPLAPAEAGWLPD